MPDLLLSFEDPKSGWITVEACVGHEVRRFPASNVLNDPLQEVASSALGLLRGDSHASVHFWLEPETFILDLGANAARTHVTARLLYSTDTEMDSVAGDVVAETLLSVADVCGALVRSLEVLDVPAMRSELDSHWGGFPSNSMRAVRDKLKAAR